MKSFAFFARNAALALAMTVGAPANAALLAVTSYNMPNGDGQASGGTFNYWDRNYTGAGSTITDGAALSGGLGKLTDGFISTQPWYLVSNNAGTGDYVGWYRPTTANPVVKFNFAGSPVVNSIAIQMDNTGVGGVFAPSSILIDGVGAAFTAPLFGTVGIVNFTGLNLLGASHTITFNQLGGTWTFVSEVQFNGVSSGIPETSTWIMMLLGFAGLGFAGYRKSKGATALAAA